MRRCSMPTQLRESSRPKACCLGRAIGVDLPYQRVSRWEGRPPEPSQLFSYAFDGIFSFSVLPLKVRTGIGVMVSSSAFFTP